jgi:hypothetical protein
LKLALQAMNDPEHHHGICDVGSIGSGTMEVCCFVVDFEIGRKVIEDDLKCTEFGYYTRIYDQNAAC